MIQNKQNEIRQALKPGKYTLLGVSDMMATTTKTEIEITEIQDKPNYAQYSNVSVVVFKQRGKRKLAGRYVKESDLYLAGWDLGLVRDADDPRKGNTDGFVSVTCFSGNALINLRGIGDAIRAIIDKAFVWGNKGLCIYQESGSISKAKDLPLYPELAEIARTKHAVLDRIMAA